MLGKIVMGAVLCILFAIIALAMNPPTAWLKKLTK